MKKQWVRWTDHELRRLRVFYPVLTHDELLREFAPHNYRAIETAALRLGVSRRTKWGYGKKPNGRKRDWRIIAESHRPRIILAAPVAHERRS